MLPETIIEDRPASFRGYRPTNFDLTYQGDVTVRQALQMSLNVPAVRLLDAVGPQRFASRLAVAGVDVKLPDGEAPGLPMALGGLGITLLPRLAVAGGVTAGAEVAVRPLAGAFGRRIGLAWRARSPRAEEFRALAPSIAAALSDR